MEKITFLGLGHMGAAMCELLLKAGYPMNTVVHRTRTTAERLNREYGLEIKDSYPDAFREADVIVSCLPFNYTVRDVFLNEENVKAMKPGTVILEMTSSQQQLMEEVDAFVKPHGIHLVDAPVSGVPGTFLVMASGEQEVVEKSKPILLSMGREVVYCGAAGVGSLIKSLNNLMLAVDTMAVAECANILRDHPEVDPQQFAQIIEGSSGYSKAFGYSFLRRYINHDETVVHEYCSISKDMKNALDACKTAVVPMSMFSYELMRLHSEYDHEDANSVYKIYTEHCNKK